MPLLSVRHLTTVFPVAGVDVPVLQDISFDIARGETLALVGESGSGKSLTALSLMRLVPPPGRIVSGEVWLDGRNLLTLGERAMDGVRGARLSLIFQEPMSALNPVRTIGSQLVEALEVHGLGGPDVRRTALDTLAAVQMDRVAERFGQFPHELSGGLRQRAMIALALACRPALVVADEPTTSLDVTLQAEVLNLLRQLKQEFGLSVLLVTHDFGVVAHTADRVAVMYAGRIVEEASVRQLFRSPAHPYTQALLKAMPGAGHSRDGRMEPIPGQVPALGQWGVGCAFSPRCAWRHEACTEVPELYPVADRHVSRCHLVRAARDFTDG